jgi:hypothetical protein
MAVLAVWDSVLTRLAFRACLAGASANGESGRREPLGAHEGPNTERAGRCGPAAVALAAGRESMGVGMVARRGGQRDWKQGSTAREAIRRATFLAPGKQPGWLTAAVAEAERGLIAQAAEPPEDPRGSERAG